MSSPRVNAASVYFNGSLWVTGGQSNAGILDTTEWYIFAQDKWIQGPTLPMVRNIWFLPPLVTSKREKNILSLSQLVCLSLYIF